MDEVGGCGFNPWPGSEDQRPKTIEIVLIDSLLGGWSIKGIDMVFYIVLGGLDHPLIPERSTAASHGALRWVKCGGQIWHPLGCETFTFE